MVTKVVIDVSGMFVYQPDGRGINLVKFINFSISHPLYNAMVEGTNTPIKKQIIKLVDFVGNENRANMLTSNLRNFFLRIGYEQ